MPADPYDSDAHPFDGPEEQVRHLDDLFTSVAEVEAPLQAIVVASDAKTERSRWATAWDAEQAKAEFGDDLHRKGPDEIERLRRKEQRLSSDAQEAVETLERWKRERAGGGARRPS